MGRLFLERVLTGPVGVNIDEFNGFQPDLVVVPGDALPADADRHVEVPSPSTKSRDRKMKAILDPEAETAEMRTPTGARTFRRTLRSKAIPGLALALGPVFKRE